MSSVSPVNRRSNRFISKRVKATSPLNIHLPTVHRVTVTLDFDLAVSIESISTEIRPLATGVKRPSWRLCFRFPTRPDPLQYLIYFCYVLYVLCCNSCRHFLFFIIVYSTRVRNAYNAVCHLVRFYFQRTYRIHEASKVQRLPHS